MVARIASASDPRRITTGWAEQEVDRHRSKRCRQVVEVIDVEVGGGDAAQEQLHVLAAVQSRGRHDPASQPELEARRIRASIGLATNVLVREGGGAKELVPVERRDERLEFTGIHAAGERAADQSAHARSGGHVDRDAVLLQPANDTHMGDAARASSTEGEADRRPTHAPGNCRRDALRTRWRHNRRGALKRRGARRAHHHHERHASVRSVGAVCLMPAPFTPRAASVRRHGRGR